MRFWLTTCLPLVALTAAFAAECQPAVYSDLEDQLCKWNECIEMDGNIETFGLKEGKVNAKICKDAKLACIKYRKCHESCFTEWGDPNNPYSSTNPCRLVIPLCKDIDPKAYLNRRKFIDNDPFII